MPPSKRTVFSYVQLFTCGKNLPKGLQMIILSWKGDPQIGGLLRCRQGGQGAGGGLQVENKKGRNTESI